MARTPAMQAISARAEIACIACVLAIRDHREPLPPRERDELIEQLVFAKVTAVGWIAGVTRVAELFRLNDANGETELPPDLQCLVRSEEHTPELQPRGLTSY